MKLGHRVYGAAAIALGLVGLAFGDFALVWQPVPASVPHRTLLAYAVAAAFVLAGAALNQRRWAAWGAAGLGLLYGLGTLLLHGPRVAAHPLEIGAWNGLAEQLALTAGGLLAYLSVARVKAGLAARLASFGQAVFALCLLSFGAAHFAYLSFTAGMVPKWLPPGQTFWAVATGLAHIAAGLAILFRVRARLAAILLTVMFAAFGALVHAPLLLADPHRHMNWASNAINLALTAAAWVVAESLGGRRSSGR